MSGRMRQRRKARIQVQMVKVRTLPVSVFAGAILRVFARWEFEEQSSCKAVVVTVFQRAGTKEPKTEIGG